MRVCQVPNCVIDEGRVSGPKPPRPSPCVVDTGSQQSVCGGCAISVELQGVREDLTTAGRNTANRGSASKKSPKILRAGRRGLWVFSLCRLGGHAPRGTLLATLPWHGPCFARAHARIPLDMLLLHICALTICQGNDIHRVIVIVTISSLLARILLRGSTWISRCTSVHWTLQTIDLRSAIRCATLLASQTRLRPQGPSGP